MKSTVTRLTPPAPKFIPVKVEIICETEQELATLYQIGNAALGNIEKVIHPCTASPEGLQQPLKGMALKEFCMRAFYWPISDIAG